MTNEKEYYRYWFAFDLNSKYNRSMVALRKTGETGVPESIGLSIPYELWTSDIRRFKSQKSYLDFLLALSKEEWELYVVMGAIDK